MLKKGILQGIKTMIINYSENGILEAFIQQNEAYYKVSEVCESTIVTIFHFMFLSLNEMTKSAIVKCQSSHNSLILPQAKNDELSLISH